MITWEKQEHSCTLITMIITRASGILQKIHTFLHGIFSPPPVEEEDDLPFLDDLAWLQETERIRQDALLFWSESSLNRYRSLSELSAPSRFYEKHSTSLSEYDLNTLNARSGASQDQPREVIFEPPAQQAVPEMAAGTGRGVPAGTPLAQPCTSFVDPLEDLYEPVEAGFVPVWEKTSHPYSDLYAVIMRMSTSKKRQ